MPNESEPTPNAGGDRTSALLNEAVAEAASRAFSDNPRLSVAGLGESSGQAPRVESPSTPQSDKDSGAAAVVGWATALTVDEMLDQIEAEEIALNGKASAREYMAALRSKLPADYQKAVGAPFVAAWHHYFPNVPLTFLNPGSEFVINVGGIVAVLMLAKRGQRRQRETQKRTQPELPLKEKA